MRSRRSLAAICTLTIVGVLAAGCSGSTSGSASSSSAPTAGSSSAAAVTGTSGPAGAVGSSVMSATPPAAADLAKHRGGTFNMIWLSAGTSIDTAVDYDPNWFVLRMTGDGLMSWKQVGGSAGNDLVPDLATTTPAPTDGGKTYTFTVRPDIKYSTGSAVKASDFVYTITREFKVPGPGVGLYAGIVGAEACITKPAACDLSKGVIADDAAHTVTFHLTAPDSAFLQKLALPFAYVVPSGTPNVDTGTTPLPATGPYLIKSFTPNRSMELVRNPMFKQWSKDAQPDGYPDAISMKIGIADEDAVTQVENGQADWVYDPPPADRLNEIATKYAAQIHINPTPNSYFMAMNTKVAPFDNVDVRQALNFATDRKAIIALFGGPRLATASCQILPSNFPGYQPNCPYTANPGTSWSAPDLAKAQALIDKSGTKGQKVVVVGTTDETTKAIDLYFVSLLNQLGYQASLKTLSASVEYSYVQDSRNKVQLSYSYWSPDYTAASNFLNVQVGCSGFHAASTASANLSEFCDPAIQAKTVTALATQSTDPTAAAALWAEIDKLTTAAAPQVTLFDSNRLDFVSTRVGNYQFSPAVTANFLIDQAWVQ